MKHPKGTKYLNPEFGFNRILNIINTPTKLNIYYLANQLNIMSSNNNIYNNNNGRNGSYFNIINILPNMALQFSYSFDSQIPYS